MNLDLVYLPSSNLMRSLRNHYSVILTCVCILLYISNAQETIVGLAKIEGKVLPPDVDLENWATVTKVLVNGGEYLGFVR